MTVVSTRTFLENPSRFFNLARKEDIAVRRGKTIFQLTPKSTFENPSPSGDPFFADPRNVAELERRLKERRSEKVAVTLRTPEDISKYLGLG